MAFLSAQQVSGDEIRMLRTNPKHISSIMDPPTGGENGDFAELLMKALNGVNQLQLDGDRLSQMMITDPDSVDVHDVTIALSKANLAVSITKEVVDRALRAYSDIINIR